MYRLALPRVVRVEFHRASLWFARPRARAALVLLLSVSLFATVRPPSWSESDPLPWDMAHHHLGALRVASAIAEGSPGGLWREFRAADLYPPAHSFVFGAFFALAGSGPSAWLVLGLILYGATALLIARRTLLGALFFLALIQHGALAPTLMVEPLANLLLMATLLSIGRGLDSDSWRPALGTALLVGATLLTKYNVGLPLLVAIPLVALLRRDRKAMRRGLAMAALPALFLLGFLAVQHDGFEMFFRFAQNRENSAGLNAFERLGRYAQFFRSYFTGSHLFSLLLLTSAGSALLLRRPVATAAVLYFLISAAALAHHEYALARNLSAPSIALVLAAGVGAESQLRRLRFRPARSLAVALTLSVVVLGLPQRRAEAARFLNPPRESLEQLSARVRSALREDAPIRVIGTFNEFGPSWVSILASRAGAAAPPRFELPYPLPPSRAGLPSHWDEAYQRAVDDWSEHGEDTVLAISLSPESPLRGRDYALWADWKENLVTAVERHPRYAEASRDSLTDGIVVRTFRRLDTLARAD